MEVPISMRNRLWMWLKYAVLACENIRFSSLFVAVDVSRVSATKSEEKRMFSQANAVSVFRRFSTRYFGICHFFLRYCGIGYPPMSPSLFKGIFFCSILWQILRKAVSSRTTGFQNEAEPSCNSVHSRTVINRQGPGISPSYCKCGPQLLSEENRRKVALKENPAYLLYFPCNLKS